MRQTELHLTDEDCELIEAYRSKGLHHAREVNRAHIFPRLITVFRKPQIITVLGLGRTAIWRTRAAYLEGGVEFTQHEVAARENHGNMIPMSRRRFRHWPVRHHQRGASR